MKITEPLSQFLQGLEERYHYDLDSFWDRVQAPERELEPASPQPLQARASLATEAAAADEKVFTIRNAADWQAATEKLADIHLLTDWLGQNISPDNEILLRGLRKYREQIEKKLALPADEEDQNAENWLEKAGKVKEKYFETLLVFLHRRRDDQYQPLVQLTQQYFAGLGWQEKTFSPGELIFGQEDWFRIEALPNQNQAHYGVIADVEIQPYFIRYAGEEKTETFIFPGKAYVYAR